VKAPAARFSVSATGADGSLSKPGEAPAQKLDALRRIRRGDGFRSMGDSRTRRPSAAAFPRG